MVDNLVDKWWITFNWSPKGRLDLAFGKFFFDISIERQYWEKLKKLSTTYPPLIHHLSTTPNKNTICPVRHKCMPFVCLVVRFVVRLDYAKRKLDERLE